MFGRLIWNEKISFLMTDTLPFIRTFLETTKLDFEIMDCEPDLADTNIFCKKIRYQL